MQKFIITIDGELRFGDVRLHKDLLPWGDDGCHGGGLWKAGRDGSCIDLYGCSYDFGAPDFTQIRSIAWDGIGGVPVRLRYLPGYPDEEGVFDITAG